MLAMERQPQNIKRSQLEADRKHATAANQVTSPSEYNPTALNVNATNDLSMPERWITPDKSAQKDNAPALINAALDDNLKWKVVNGEVRTGIADAGASVTCGKPEVSECGRIRLDSNPFIPTTRKSKKILQYGGGSLAAADQIKQLPFNMRDEARDVHMVPGIQNTLISTNEMALEKYVTVFDDQEVNIYDQNDVEIKSNRGAVLRGWRIPGEGLWRIPTETNTHNNKNTGIFIVNKKTVRYIEQSSTTTARKNKQRLQAQN